MEKNLINLIESACLKFNDRIVYEDDKSHISYSQVLDMAQKMASFLYRISYDTPIMVIGNRSVSTIVSYLGIVFSGHAYAPVDGDLPLERIHKICDVLKPHTILYAKEYADLANELCNQYYAEGFLIDTLFNLKKDIGSLNAVKNSVISTNPLYVIFTSGSTGVPKGVFTSQLSLMCYIDGYIEMMKISKDDILGNQSPLDYIAAIRDIYVPFFTGCKTVIIPKEYFAQPSILFDFMNARQVSVIGWSVSALMLPVSLGVFEENNLKTVKKICFSGSVIPNSCLQIWQRNLPDAQFVNQYGPTEATASCTYYKIDHFVNLDEDIPIGQPYKHYKIYILDSNLSIAKKGEIGEICIAGPILALGYYNDLDRTNKSFINNPNTQSYNETIYRTGDYGRWREDGLLEYHGRVDRQIKYMGHRVELDEVELTAMELQGIDECLVFFDEEKERICMAYKGIMQKKDLIIHFREKLPAYMVPRKIKQIDEIPKLPNGKNDVQELRRNFL